MSPGRAIWGGLAVVLFVLAAGCSDERQSRNQPPVANAGIDLVVDAGQAANLDGSLSFDPDGDQILYHWTLAAAPEGSQASLEHPDRVSTQLTPVLVGEYLVRLVVSDGELESEPDLVNITAREPPVPCDTVADCDDQNSCTHDACDPSVGCSWTYHSEACDDGLFCTADDRCDGAGSCLGSGETCADECQSDCDEEQDLCRPVPDDSPCGEKTCQDGDWRGGRCQAGVCQEDQLLAVCLDDNDCTLDACDPQEGCSSEILADLSPCASGQGICCAAVCHSGWECCQDSDCGISNPCVTHLCESGQCSMTQLAVGAGCDGGDGNLCNHTCDAQLECVDVPLLCDDGNPCNGAESCITSQGACLPGTSLGPGIHCTVDELVECDDSENPLSIESCPLGCQPNAQPMHCNQLDPSNFDGSLLCINQGTLVISADAVIDTNLGTISGVPPGQIQFNLVVQQDPAPDLGVFSFAGLEIESGATVTVTGHSALALAVCGEVSIAGVIDAGADLDVGGPGGFPGGVSQNPGQGLCPGQAAVDGTDACPKKCAAGGGGGGNGGDGGDGGPVDCMMGDIGITFDPGWGGAACAAADLIPLIGGSGGAGGTLVLNEPSSLPGSGGGGGGAIQISAGGGLVIASTGGIGAGGGGGGETISGGGTGGGAGGSILLEAASISLSSGAFLAANGGGGGGGDCT